MTKHAISIDLGGTNLRAALIDEQGNIFHRCSIPTAKDHSPDSVTQQIVSLCKELQQKTIQENRVLTGVGIGVPGFLLDQKIIHSSPNFPTWHNLNLSEILQQQLSLVVVLENDANCAVTGEWWKGSAVGYQCVIGLTLGTGVGGGVLEKKHLVVGSHGAGAELGHIVVDPQGPFCNCGNRGCLEALASGSSIQKRFHCSGEELTQKAKQGDPKALQIFSEIGTFLGIGITTLCFIFDPEIIVIGGNFSQAFPFFSKTLQKEMKVRLRNHPSVNTPVVISSLHDNAGLLGAACLGMGLLQ